MYKEQICANHWYRQRFDACPHFMFFLGDAHTSRIQHTAYPFGQAIAYAGFSKNRADWYHSTDELRKTADAIIEASKIDTQISVSMHNEFHSHEVAFYALCQEIDQLSLTELSDDDLLEVYKRFVDVYTNKLLASPLIDGFVLATDELIATQIRQHLQKRGEEDRFVNVFERLTAPTFTSWLAKEECALLQLALDIHLHPNEREVRLEKHQQAFFWMQNNYVADRLLSVEFFAERLLHVDIQKAGERIQELSGQGMKHQEEKNSLIESIDLPQDIQQLLKITDDCAAWQDERKKGTLFATHSLSLLLNEVSIRTGYALQELVYAMPTEMDAVFKKDLSVEVLRQRWEYCMVLWTQDSYDVITDLKTIETLDKIGTGEANPAESFTGFAASSGVVQGIVRVIESAEDVHRVEVGDVLVAVMTRPDYMPAMKKAVAFVTDEGGITCHAAIVAREMNKPCVIGTKYASKILKDGMRVEVDANKGVVRVLEV